MRSILFLFLLSLLFMGSDTVKPKILVIGDSISLGYTPFVQELMADEAMVVHNAGNARYTGYGLQEIENWLGDEKWDVIHFNWGLWDLYGWQYADTIRTPETYARNLEMLVSRLEKTGAKLIWATTTPVCPMPEVKCKFVISPEMEHAFRVSALKVMKKHHVPINDLYNVIVSKRSEFALGDNNVHYHEAGYRLLANQVVLEIRKIQR